MGSSGGLQVWESKRDFPVTQSLDMSLYYGMPIRLHLILQNVINTDTADLLIKWSP